MKAMKTRAAARKKTAPTGNSPVPKPKVKMKGKGKRKKKPLPPSGGANATAEKATSAIPARIRRKPKNSSHDGRVEKGCWEG